MKVSINKNQYFHPVYSVKKPISRNINWRRHLHRVCFTIAIAGFMLPIVTNPLLKEDNEELQRAIKLFSYSSMLLAALVGWKNESDNRTIEQRRYDDMDLNKEYALNRLNKQHEFARSHMMATAAHDLKSLERAQGMGAYGLPYYPEALASIALQRFAPAPQEQSENSVPAITADVFTLPSLTDNENKKTIDDAYDYISDRKKRNYLGLLICGTSGDNKTTMMHYAIYKWLLKEPDLIPYICDRKYYSDPENIKWRSNWNGVPVFHDVRDIVRPGVPHPSVYAEFNPDIMTWLEPVYKLLVMRTGHQQLTASNEEKLVNPVTGKYRPVVILIDDATSLLGKLQSDNRQKYETVIHWLNELTTLGRSANITLFFIAHHNTAGATGLSTEALAMLEPVVGKSMLGDMNAMKWFKRPIIEEGANYVLNYPDGKVRSFATSWKDYPYLPPAPYTQERGMLDIIIPELTKMWLATCPDNFVIQDYQIQALGKLGIADVNQLRHPSTTIHTQQELTEKQALAILRKWARENEVDDDDALIKKFSEISSVPVIQIADMGHQLRAIVDMNQDEFDSLK